MQSSEITKTFTKLWLFFLSQTPQSHPHNTKMTIIFFCFDAINSYHRLRHHFHIIFFSLREAPPSSTIHVDSNTQKSSTRLWFRFVEVNACTIHEPQNAKTKNSIKSKLHGHKRRKDFPNALSLLPNIYIFFTLFPNRKLTLCIRFERVCISFTSFAMRLLLISHSLHYAYTLMHTIHAYLWVAIAQWRRFFQQIFLAAPECVCVCAFLSVYCTQLHIKI